MGKVLNFPSPPQQSSAVDAAFPGFLGKQIIAAATSLAAANTAIIDAGRITALGRDLGRNHPIHSGEALHEALAAAISMISMRGNPADKPILHACMDWILDNGGPVDAG